MDFYTEFAWGLRLDDDMLKFAEEKMLDKGIGQIVDYGNGPLWYLHSEDVCEDLDKASWIMRALLKRSKDPRPAYFEYACYASRTAVGCQSGGAVRITANSTEWKHTSDVIYDWQKQYGER